MNPRRPKNAAINIAICLRTMASLPGRSAGCPSVEFDVYPRRRRRPWTPEDDTWRRNWARPSSWRTSLRGPSTASRGHPRENPLRMACQNCPRGARNLGAIWLREAAVALWVFWRQCLQPFEMTVSTLFLDPETGPQALPTLLLWFLLLSVFQSTKAFSFHYRSSLNFVHRLVTMFSTIALSSN